MRTASSTLIAALAAKTPMWPADLYTITLFDGTILRWTTADRAVTVDGYTWLATGALLSRSSMSMKNTVEVSELVVKFAADSTVMVLGVPMKLAFVWGLFDRATVQLDRCFVAVWGDTSLGRVALFVGRMGPAKIGGLECEFTARGANVVLNQNLPKNLYQTTCLHTLYDAGCAVDRNSFKGSYVYVAAGSTPTFLAWITPPGIPAVLNRGYVKFTSGPALAQSRTIKISDATGTTIFYPFYAAPEDGDTYDVFQGCDLTYATCGSQFANQQHYRGFEFIPDAETAV